MLVSKVLYRSRAGSHFYGSEYEIWAGSGPVGNNEKRAIKYSTFEGVFYVFMGFFNVVASALKSCAKSMWENQNLDIDFK